MFARTAIRRYTAEQVAANTKGSAGGVGQFVAVPASIIGVLCGILALNRTYPATRKATEFGPYNGTALLKSQEKL